MVNWKYILAFFVALATISCSKNNSKGTIYKELSAFSEIEIESNFDIFLVEDSLFSIEIQGYKKSIAKVEFAVEANVLKIKNAQKFRFTHPKTNKITIYIHAKPLRLVSANETCFIRTVNPITSDEFGLIFKSKANFADLELNGNIFYYWNNFPCGGKLTLHGKTNLLKIWNTALLSVDAKNVLTDYAYVQNGSKGLCEVHVTNKIEYSILGDGNIELYGQPPIQNKIEKTGKGELILH